MSTQRTGDPYFGVWGRDYKFSTATTGIMEIGGAHSTEMGYYTDVNDGPIVRFLAQAGFPMVSPNVPSTYGNDASQATMSATVAYGKANLGFGPTKVNLKGGSMGGLACLNWARSNPTLVNAIVLTTPATDLTYLHDNNIAGLAAEIETAYGGAAGYAAAVDAHNPALHTADFTGFPIKLFYSTDDPLIPPAQAQAFGAAVRAEVVSMGAVGHTVAGLAPEAVSNFFAAH